MRIELQEKLFKKYPKIFRQRKLPAKQTCMCWGIECGDGWYKLIDRLCEKLVKVDPKLEVMQVKQKFGGLRFYTAATNEKAQDLINKAETESFKLCEVCSSADAKQNKEGWIKTLCKKCRRKEKHAK